MRLYNTLTRKTEEIQPINKPIVTVYTCGPTVYDYAHIGHWFTYLRADLLVRALKLAGFKSKWVMNITDVGHLVSDADEGEDKLEKGARREGKTAWEVADFYTHDFLTGMKTLNMLEPDHIVKATNHIPEQIALIKRLEAKGYTYVIDDGVYYSTGMFKNYAKLARLNLDEQQGSGRVASNPQKHNPSDFALWKFSPKDSKRDMEWESPWGKGFPGWHIECSAMSMKYLGETLDIHTGGIDHIPVHHTNEIAQSEAATGKKFANMWMHTNHIMVNGDKISKSLGNGINLQDIKEHGISPDAIRLHVLESHYRSQSQFSWDGLEAAQNRVRGYEAMADLRWQAKKNGAQFDFREPTEQINKSLLEDLDTPNVLALLSAIETTLTADLIRSEDLKQFVLFLNFLDDALGLRLGSREDITVEQKDLIARRQQARKTKSWEESDKLRDQLKDQGIRIRDTDEGQFWYRF